MEKTQVTKIVERQRDFFLSGATLDIDFRINNLKKLKDAFKKHEQDIIAAVKKDMGRNEMETYVMELHTVENEINNTLKHIKEWTAEKHVKTPTMFFMSDSLILPEPLGTVLIISAWNFPTWQIFGPLVGAIAAGNTAILKPAGDASACGQVINKIVSETFPPEYIICVEGPSSITTILLEERFDLIFFTGSPRVGKIIQAAAAKYLTPVILELGGKSPAIVDPTADIDQAAKRIAWSKLFNTGQICVTVDHVYVHKSIKQEFVEAVRKHIREFFGNDPSQNPEYGFIINEKNFDRLVNYINSANGSVIHGGHTDKAKRYIEPTILDNVREGDDIMMEEIFGPILPVLEYEDLDALINLQKRKEKPLALYFFSKNPEAHKKVLHNTSSGGVTINDCMSHGGSQYLPFGGVGNSGMGCYVGKASFDAFTHHKPVMNATTSHFLDISFRYPPYDGKLKKLKSVQRFM